MLRMIERGVGSPATTSVGRLFDAVAALLGLHGRVSFEGQAAMALEAAARGVSEPAAYELTLVGGEPGDPIVLDWEPLIRALLADRDAGVAVGRVSARFHDALVDAARAIAERAGLEHVVLSGGCFQNARLAGALCRALEARGFRVHLPAAVPPNDGGIALGQVWVARAQARGSATRT
jgi:hydrogenase maturation protein HypF